MKESSLIPDIRHLEAKVRKLQKEVVFWKERALRLRDNKLPYNETREKVKKYRKNHPEATIREIQAALKLSSTRCVTFHLQRIEEAKKLINSQDGNQESDSK